MDNTEITVFNNDMDVCPKTPLNSQLTEAFSESLKAVRKSTFNEVDDSEYSNAELDHRVRSLESELSKWVAKYHDIESKLEKVLKYVDTLEETRNDDEKSNKLSKGNINFDQIEFPSLSIVSGPYNLAKLKMSSNQVNLLNTVSHEQNEKDRRKNNILIICIPES